MKEPYKRPTFNKLPVSNHTIDFFKGRGISTSTLAHYRVTDAIEWMPGKDGEHDGKPYSIKAGNCYAIAFNYYLRGEHVNTKFRASQKRFKMVSGAELSFYGIDFLEGVSECAIQEGEIDTLSAYECGITNSVSVPNGASIGSNLKLEYLDNCIGMFDGIQRIVIAADGDAAGRSLSAELIRRLGPERCFVVEYPKGARIPMRCFEIWQGSRKGDVRQCKARTDCRDSHGRAGDYRNLRPVRQWISANFQGRISEFR